jgi:hypothetical protein
MHLDPDDVYSLTLGHLPVSGESFLLVYANQMVVPARREVEGCIDARTYAPPLGEPIGWTYHKPPLIEPKWGR